MIISWLGLSKIYTSISSSNFKRLQCVGPCLICLPSHASAHPDTMHLDRALRPQSWHVVRMVLSIPLLLQVTPAGPSLPQDPCPSPETLPLALTQLAATFFSWFHQKYLIHTNCVSGSLLGLWLSLSPAPQSDSQGDHTSWVNLTLRQWGRRHIPTTLGSPHHGVHPIVVLSLHDYQSIVSSLSFTFS